jgi:hypothetical protein
MKNLRFLLLTVLISGTLSAQNFEWAKQLTDPSLEVVQSMAVYPGGEFILGGIFSNTCDMDPGIGEFILENSAGFLGKYDTDGELLWAFRIEERVDDVAYDNQGNVYATGGFNGTFDFDPGDGVFELSSTGLNYAFLAKYDQDGNFLWAIAISGEGNVYGLALTVDNGNDLLVTGS